MQIVIDLSENVYTRLYDNGVDLSKEDIEAIEIAIRKGNILPKGHGRLIEANKLFTRLCVASDGKMIPNRDCDNWYVEIPIERVKSAITSAKTIIEADKED